MSPARQREETVELAQRWFRGEEVERKKNLSAKKKTFFFSFFSSLSLRRRLQRPRSNVSLHSFARFSITFFFARELRDDWFASSHKWKRSVAIRMNPRQRDGWSHKMRRRLVRRRRKEPMPLLPIFLQKKGVNDDSLFKLLHTLTLRGNQEQRQSCRRASRSAFRALADAPQLFLALFLPFKNRDERN